MKFLHDFHWFFHASFSFSFSLYDVYHHHSKNIFQVAELHRLTKVRNLPRPLHKQTAHLQQNQMPTAGSCEWHLSWVHKKRPLQGRSSCQCALDWTILIEFHLRRRRVTLRIYHIFKIATDLWLLARIFCQKDGSKSWKRHPTKMTKARFALCEETAKEPFCFGKSCC